MASSITHNEALRLAAASQGKDAGVRVARLLDTTIFTGLLALIALVAIPHGTVDQEWQALFECGVFGLAGLWIVEGWLTGRWLISGRSLLWPMLAFILLALFQTLPFWGTNVVAGIDAWRAYSSDPYETRLVAFRLIALTLTLALLMRFTSSPSRMRALVYFVIGLGVTSALFAMTREIAQRAYPGFLSGFLEPGKGFGWFVNRNHFAFQMEMSLGLVLGLVAAGGVRRDRLPVHLAAGVVLWATLVFSNSRGGVISMFGQLIFTVLLFTVVRRRKKSDGAAGLLRRLSGSLFFRLGLVAFLVFVVAIGTVWVGGDSLVSRLETAPDEISLEANGKTTTDQRRGERRSEIWRATWQLIKAHPVAGVGFGAYATAIPRYHDASGEVLPQQAHNDYLELLASGGLIGLAVGAWFSVAFIRMARRQLRANNSFRRAACFGALVGIFGVALHSLFDFGLHATLNALVFQALVVVAAVSYIEKPNRRNELSL